MDVYTFLLCAKVLDVLAKRDEALPLPPERHDPTPPPYPPEPGAWPVAQDTPQYDDDDDDEYEECEENEKYNIPKKVRKRIEREAALKIARRMYRNCEDIEMISEYTRLSIQFLEDNLEPF